MSSTKHKLPAPQVNRDTQPYWEGSARGELLIKKCNSCNQAYFYPRPLCPFCMSEETIWFKASGNGVVYSYTHAKRSPHFNFPALITLEEGPTIMSAVIGCDESEISVGQQVTVKFVETDAHGALPVFTV